MLNKLVALILFLHPCHCPMKDSNRVEAIQKDAKRREDEFDPDWLAGAIEHKFCERIEPEPEVAITSDDGDTGPESSGTAESDEPVPEEGEAEDNLAASSEAVGSAATTAAEEPDGAKPVAKPAAVKKVVKAV